LAFTIVTTFACGAYFLTTDKLCNNADWEMVAIARIFIALRQITNKPILLLSGVHSREELQQALDLNCHCVVHHSSQITLINNITQALNI
jgi:alanine racemase